ncbi:MAG: hemerythrin family protein [Rhodospirillales bacterium]|nr:hemerythrin family protein [Rhodospirillales bacterium]
MQAIQWRKDFETGIMSIDHEHKTLIASINEFCNQLETDNTEEEILKHLGGIHALVEAHFALEEHIMADTRYEGFSDHKQDHDRLLDEILDIMDKVHAKETLDYKSALGTIVTNWFATHFSTLDKTFHLQAHGGNKTST